MPSLDASASEGGGGSSPAAAPPGPMEPQPDNFEQRSFPVVEAQLPDRLGMPRDLIRTLRENLLKKGAHWIKPHRDILLTEEAVEILLKGHAALKNAIPSPERLAAINVAPGENGDRSHPVKSAPTNSVELRVQRILPWNRKQLLAQLPGGIAPVTVRVQDTANYMPGMTIYARHDHGVIYSVTGRQPRFRGERLYRED